MQFIATVLILLPAVAASLGAQAARQASECGRRPGLRLEAAPLALQTGTLAHAEQKCFDLLLRAGEFIRITVKIDSGYVHARVLEPGGRKARLTTWILPDSEDYTLPVPLAFEATVAGVYMMELTSQAGAGSSPITFRLQVQEHRSATSQATHRAALQRDPRTRWLRANALRIRSINAEDEDFSDLEPLREQLNGVQVILLGESDHGNGSDFTAKTRFVRFLHQRMGFNVLAFESGIFSTSVASEMLRTDSLPRAAFLMGVFRIWGWSEQLQPLIQYLAASARTDRPLKLTGFDTQFSGAASPWITSALRDYLLRSGIVSPLVDSQSTATRTLAAIAKWPPPMGPAQLPSSTERAELVATLRAAAAAADKRVSEPESSWWAQVLRSAAIQTTLFQERDSTWDDLRDRQMAENLLWLLSSHHKGEKVIVWAAAYHVMRSPSQPIGTWRYQRTPMGQGVWDVLGDRSFAIGFTSYAGTSLWATASPEEQQSVVPDQHPGFEFEELMNAAGHEVAWLNLRKARHAQRWLREPFLARPLNHISARVPWSKVFDALVFIRTQEPSRRVAGAR